MESFISQAWQFLLNIYYNVANNGYEGCAIALVVGVVLQRKGVSMTGQKESFSGRQGIGDTIDITHHPEIIGTADGFIGQLIGTMLNLSGAILILIAIIAFANILS